MTPEQVTDIGREAIITLLYVSGPVMLVALLIGLIVALFQALTSLQEMTLTFVPKIVVVFLSLLAFMPFMSDRLALFWSELTVMMVTGGDQDGLDSE